MAVVIGDATLFLLVAEGARRLAASPGTRFCGRQGRCRTRRCVSGRSRKRAWSCLEGAREDRFGRGCKVRPWYGTRSLEGGMRCAGAGATLIFQTLG